MKKILDNIHRNPSFWRNSLLSEISEQKVVIEFSSPNIAKPFHMGHLRSSIVGNFISNIHKCLGHQVTKINYLGDWGTQFGILKYGYDSKKMSPEDLAEDPIKTLYNLYVWANLEAEKSESIFLKAKSIFNSLENSEENHLNTWKLFRDLSINSYQKIYERLNIQFDEYHGESMYNKDQCNSILNLMENKGILFTNEDGRKMYKFKSNSNKNLDKNDSNNLVKVTVVKSDGSTMYLTRDIAAAFDRFKTYNFDKMYYVVDNSQHFHFLVLFNILTDLDVKFSDILNHVKFGRVKGMSTRKGTAIFLEDVLNEAKDLMQIKQKESKNTQIMSEVESLETADIIGASALIIANLKRKRMKDFNFSWQDALQSSGETGVRLQYTHCRLFQLEANCGVEFSHEIDTNLLNELEAVNLVNCLQRYEQVLLKSYETFESSVLVGYLFDLCDAINKAFKKLPIKNSPNEVAKARLKLFSAARITLAAGFKVLGLKPLRRM